jgi:hypothetical protein
MVCSYYNHLRQISIQFSQLNYRTPNWIDVVLSRVTTLDGLFLLQPLKANFNPEPSKLLQEEWKRQQDQELEPENIIYVCSLENQLGQSLAISELVAFPPPHPFIL